MADDAVEAIDYADALAALRPPGFREGPDCPVWWDVDRWWVPRCLWHRLFCGTCKAMTAAQMAHVTWLREVGFALLDESCPSNVLDDESEEVQDAG